MNDETILIIKYGDAKKAFFEWSKELDSQKASVSSPEKTFSINQVSKMLGRSHSKIKGLIKKDILKTTSDERRILESSLNDYMKSKTNTKQP
jgi:hypothetical protein